MALISIDKDMVNKKTVSVNRNKVIYSSAKSCLDNEFKNLIFMLIIIYDTKKIRGYCGSRF